MGLVAAVGTAVTAVASSIGIGITATALTVGFTTIAAVGAAVSVVGMVTKNKILSTVGMVLGGIGGVGALASGAGLLGAGEGLFGGAASSTPAAADLAAEGSVGFVDSGTFTSATAAAGENVAAGATDAAAATSGAPGFIDNGAFTAGNATAAASGPGVSDLAGAAKSAAGPFLGGSSTEDALKAQKALVSDGSVPAVASPPAAAPPVASVTPPPVASPGTSAGSSALINSSSFNQDAAGNITTPGTGAPSSGSGSGGSSDGFFGNILDFAKKNPVVALGVLQSAGSFLSGATSTLTPAQVALYNSQASANDAATALVKQQTANLAAPKAVAQSVPVTGQAQLVPINARPPPVPAPQGGLINQAPVQSAPVTAQAA